MSDTERALAQAKHDIAAYADRMAILLDAIPSQMIHRANMRMADPSPPAGSLHGALITVSARNARRIEVAL